MANIADNPNVKRVRFILYPPIADPAQAGIRYTIKGDVSPPGLLDVYAPLAVRSTALPMEAVNDRFSPIVGGP
jgi:hypothetical protein